jgi:hypothetical protein
MKCGWGWGNHFPHMALLLFIPWRCQVEEKKKYMRFGERTELLNGSDWDEKPKHISCSSHFVIAFCDRVRKIMEDLMFSSVLGDLKEGLCQIGKMEIAQPVPRLIAKEQKEKGQTTTTSTKWVWKEAGAE